MTKDDSGYLTALALIREFITHDDNEGAARGVVEAVLSGEHDKTLRLITALAGMIIKTLEEKNWSDEDILRAVEETEFDLLAGAGNE